MQRGRPQSGKVGLLWREKAIYVAENGVCVWGWGVAARQAGATFSGKLGDWKKQ